MKIAILGSGQGSNAEAILKSWKANQLGQATPVALLSDNADSRFLLLGDTYGIPDKFIDPGPKKTWLIPEAEERYIQALRECGADLVVLAGFMRVLKQAMLKAFEGRIINLHPSLLPSFKGLHAIEQAWEYGVKITGCTVHYVNQDVDGGRIIDQLPVRIDNSDTLDTLEEKIHEAEHQLLPQVIARLSQE